MPNENPKDSLQSLRKDLESITDEEHNLNERTNIASERLGQYIEGSDRDLRNEIIEEILGIENLIKERYPRIAEGIRSAVRIINETI